MGKVIEVYQREHVRCQIANCRTRRLEACPRTRWRRPTQTSRASFVQRVGCAGRSSSFVSGVRSMRFYASAAETSMPMPHQRRTSECRSTGTHTEREEAALRARMLATLLGWQRARRSGAALYTLSLKAPLEMLTTGRAYAPCITLHTRDGIDAGRQRGLTRGHQ